MTTVLQKCLPVAALACLLLLAWLVYRPGLAGGFLFDDFANLDALGNSGSVDNWRTFWRFITSGTADPTGRPLALLSFLVDAHNWPADPAPFLRTNVLLHLFNGALLFALLRRLGRAIDTHHARVDAVALLGSALWLLHPLLVSTTLYIVQREAMLPATFVLLGLLAYDRGRSRAGRYAIAWMVGGIGAGTFLAVLCKGNGVLLPLLAWVIEATVYSHARAKAGSQPPHGFNRIKIALLIVPSVALFAYVARLLLSWNAMLAGRPWTIGQRLLTEPRVIVDYLGLLVVPHSVSTGLYNDDYIASTGLLHPASTLPAILLVLALIWTGIHFRRRWPRYSAAILFFFAGHLLESSTLPLELYFEHRNYLPAMLLFWPLANGVSSWGIARSVRIAVAVGLIGLLGFTTYARAQLWGHPDRLAHLWAHQNPSSSRAQATAAIAELESDRPVQALARLSPLWQQHPYDLQIGFNAIDAACGARGLTPADKQALAIALRHSAGDQVLMYEWIGKSIEVAVSERCPGLDLKTVESWLDAALQNPSLNTPHIRDQNIEPLLGQLAMREGRPGDALRHFDRALAAVTTPDVAARQASMLAADDDYEQALAHLDTYERLKVHRHKPGPGMPRLHVQVLEWENYWPFELALLRAKLHQAIAERDRT
jgi:tetratricopeptide (TPR) repeat protein